MAKTFKHLTQPAAAAPKPISERDFFDLTDEEATAPPVTKVPTSPATGINNTSEIPHTHNSSNTRKPVVRQQTVPAIPTEAAASEPDEDRDVRQTFVVGSRYLEKLRDHVHARRAGGDYEYSQKQALQEALDLLFRGPRLYRPGRPRRGPRNSAAASASGGGARRAAASRYFVYASVRQASNW